MSDLDRIILESGKIVDEAGEFSIVLSNTGREYLYLHGKRIAECINGEHSKRFGSIYGWIDHVVKRENKRLDKIANILSSLNEEVEYRSSIIASAKSIK